jgi:hypothetical protein
VSGTVGGVSATYRVGLTRQGEDETPNAAPRQFLFNGAAPNAVTVPEANSLALVLPALGMVGAVVIRRRKSA